MARTLTQPGPERANRLIFLGAIGLAIIAAILVFFALSNFGDDSGSASVAGGSVDVVVASRNISAGDTISNSDLELASIPNNVAVEGALTDKSSANGLVASSAIAAHEQITLARLGRSAEDCTTACVLPQGKVGVGVEVDQKAVAGGLIVAGDHVDVIVMGKNKSANSNDITNDLPVAYTLLQDIEVLSVDDTALETTTSTDATGTPVSGSDANGTTPSNTDTAPGAKTVTLIVNPDQAPAVALATQSYKVALALRAKGDKGTIEATPIILPGNIQ